MSRDDYNMSVFLERIANAIPERSLDKSRLEDLKYFRLSKNECIYVFDLSKNKLVFSKGFQNILGYDDRVITLDFIVSLYHPNDIDITNRIIEAGITYCLDNPDETRDAILLISLRIRKKDGTYIRILRESTIYEVDEMGRITSSFNKFTNISFIDHTENVSWYFKAKNLNEEDFRKQVYKKYQNFFTEREVEIIVEIEKGLTNKEIADALSISEHTVATHRKHILQKADCHGKEELILFCKGRGVL